MFDHFAAAAFTTFAQVPNPGQGQQPPGSDGFLTILEWAAWIGLAVCVAGVIICGASMAVAHRHGGASEHAARLGWVAVGCVVLGSASALVGALV